MLGLGKKKNPSGKRTESPWALENRSKKILNARRAETPKKVPKQGDSIDKGGKVKN